MRKFIVYISALVALATAHAEMVGGVATVDAVRATGGMVSEFYNTKLEPNSKPAALPVKQDLDKDQQSAADNARRMFGRNPNALSILLVDHGQIIYEEHRAPASPQGRNFSWSMSKSLTAYTIGGLLCSGKIKSLDDKASVYNPAIADTIYGDTTIRNLLCMSSAVRGQEEHKGKDWWIPLRGQQITTNEVMHIDNDLDSSIFGTVKQGERFEYNNIDTLALGSVADSIEGFTNAFDKYVWQPARTANSGHWLMAKDHKAISYGGFSATAQDWARLAMWSMDQVNNDKGCMGNFMREAVVPQIKTQGPIGKSFRSYGYQTWIGNFSSQPSYWWVGYGGQRVGVDPVKQRIIVVESRREDYMEDIYRFFGWWQGQ